MSFHLPTEPPENDTIDISQEIEKQMQRLTDCDIYILPCQDGRKDVLLYIEKLGFAKGFAVEPKEDNWHTNIAEWVLSYVYEPHELPEINRCTLGYIESERFQNDIEKPGVIMVDAYEVLKENTITLLNYALRQAFIDYWTSAGFEVY